MAEVVAVWLVWPISATTAASVTGVLLHAAALRNGRTVATRRGVAVGGALVFLVPALAWTSRVSCSDTGFGLAFWAPPTVLLAVGVPAVVGALVGLRVASGPAARPWLLPVILAAVAILGLFAETLLGVRALSQSCNDGEMGGSSLLLVVQAGLALLAPAAIVALGPGWARRIEPDSVPDSTPRAW